MKGKIMEAQDIMTRNVVSVGPEASVSEIAKLLVEHQVSAVPVVDSEFGLLGIVSERDLVRRPEIAGEDRPPWWLALTSDLAERAKDPMRCLHVGARSMCRRQHEDIA